MLSSRARVPLVISDSVDSRGAADGGQAHIVPWQHYLALLCWSVLLSIAYLVTRIVCGFGIPEDCTEPDPLEIMQDFQVMLSMGFILAIFTGFHLEERFQYIMCFQLRKPRGFFFIVTLLTSGPIFGSLDSIPILSRMSLTPAFIDKGGVNTLLLLGVIAGALALVAWHFVYAFYTNPIQGSLAYTGLRISVWTFYAVFLEVAVNTPDASFHLHHYYCGFLIAILAEFNHPISMLLLAAGTGVFVQGISAYEAASIIVRNR